MIKTTPTPPQGRAVTERLDWGRDGRDWPHRDASRFVRAGGIKWHVQQMGGGPVMLLLHGTGASTHSWRHLAPLLAEHFTVVCPDLPGHAFTETPAASLMSLKGMATLTAALVREMGLDVQWVVGHSAGAAVAAQMINDGYIAPRQLIGLNAALLPLGGMPGVLFPPVARLMAATSLVPRLFAWRASSRVQVERLLDSTGSKLDEEGVELYGRLVRDVKHVSAALTMMARWDMDALARGLHDFRTPLALVVGERDNAVPPACATQVVSLLPASTRRSIDIVRGAGHLAHEERPHEVAQLMLARTGTLGQHSPDSRLRA